MRLNDICKKLVKANISNYKILIFCLILGTMLFTSYGLLIFSPTVTNVLVDGGSTQVIAYSIYIAFFIACMAFILYSHSLFMKYKSQEIGVFISLGINKNSIKDILLKELKYILPIASLVGMTLALPFTFLVWKCITVIAGNINVGYEIGWLGFVGGILFSSLTNKVISSKTSKYLKKIDIIKILKSSESIEEVKISNYKLGIVGIIITPLGVLLANLSLRGVIFESIDIVKFVFFGMVALGLYFICVSFTSIGEFYKRRNKSTYYKNIVFFNLLKLKGRQYTLTLYTVTILIAITIFSMCFSFVNVLGKEDIAKVLAPFDFSILKNIDQNNLVTKKEIYDIAEENSIELKDYNEVELLNVVENFNQELIDRYGVSVNTATCISESDYNKIHKDNINVEPGMYYMISNDSSLFKVDRHMEKDFSGIGNSNKYNMKKQGDIFKQLTLGEKGTFGFILDDNEFENIKSQSPKDAVDTNIVFNVDDWRESYDFYKDLESLTLSSNEKGLLVYGSAFDRVYNDIISEYVSSEDVSDMDYRDWGYKVNSKIYMTTDGMKVDIMYPLLFGYIALLSLIASGMILYIKVLNTSWQDSKVYENISLIGANNKVIKRIITNQLMIIFMIPTIVGLSLGVMAQMSISGHTLTADIFRNYALGFSLIFIIVQYIVFLFARKEVLKKNKVSSSAGNY